MRIDMTSLEHSGSDTTRPKLARWIKWLLIASLAANLLVVGAIASAVWRGRSAHLFHMSGGANLAGYVGSLPHERRRDLLMRGQANRQDLVAMRGEVRAARRDMYTTLAAEPFDKQRYVDAQARLLELEVRQRTAMRPWLAEIAAAMSAEERRAFLKWRGRDRFGPQRGGDELADPPKQ
jgi:uncharacterized membrane protein